MGHIAFNTVWQSCYERTMEMENFDEITTTFDEATQSVLAQSGNTQCAQSLALHNAISGLVVVNPDVRFTARTVASLFGPPASEAKVSGWEVQHLSNPLYVTQGCHHLSTRLV